MELVGSPLVGDETDGTPIPLSLKDDAESKQEHVTIEYWGLAIPEGEYGYYGDVPIDDPSINLPPRSIGNNTYKAVRVISENYNFYYAVWCTNEAELYDLKVGEPTPREDNTDSFRTDRPGRDEKPARREARPRI